MNKDPYEHDIRCGYAGCIDQTQHSLEQLIKCVSLDGRTALEAVQIWNGKVPDRYRVPPDAFQEPAAPHRRSAAPHTLPAEPPGTPAVPRESWPPELLGQRRGGRQVPSGADWDSVLIESGDPDVVDMPSPAIPMNAVARVSENKWFVDNVNKGPEEGLIRDIKSVIKKDKRNCKKAQELESAKPAEPDSAGAAPDPEPGAPTSSESLSWSEYLESLHADPTCNPVRDPVLLSYLESAVKSHPGVSLDDAYNAVSPLVLGRPMDTAYVDQLLDDCKAFLVKPSYAHLEFDFDEDLKAASEPSATRSRHLSVSYEEEPEDFSHARGTMYVNRIRNGDYKGKSRWGDMHLPGHFSTPREHCGNRQTHGHLHANGRISRDARLWCHEIDCTTCFADGIRQFSIRAAATLWGFMMACHSGSFCLKASGPLHHVVVSCNAENGKLALDRSGRVELRRKYIDVLRNLGRYCTRCKLDAPDCSCIRLKHADGRCKLCKRKSERCKCVDGSCHTGGYHGGGMVFHGCRFTEGGLCPVWGPHFHVIAMGYVDVRSWRKRHKAAIKEGDMCNNPTAEYEKQTGTVIRRIERRSRKPGDSRYMDIEYKSELGGLTYYLASHMTRALGEHGIVYFGTAANNRYGVKKAKCHKADIQAYLKKWFNENVRRLKRRGKQYDLVHVRVQQVDVNPAEDESRHSWVFKPVERLRPDGKNSLGNALLGYLQAQAKAHAYVTGASKAEYRRPLETFIGNYKSPMSNHIRRGGAVAVETDAPDAKSSDQYSMSRYIIVELTYAYKHKEKQHTRYLCLDIDPSFDDLCPVCFKPLDVLLPRSGVYPKVPDTSTTSLRLDLDADRWYVWNRLESRGRGVPFRRPKNVIHEWSYGLKTEHPYEPYMSPEDQAAISEKFLLSYARLYANHDNSTFMELYSKHCAKHQLEPTRSEWKAMRKESREMSIANALKYLKRNALPVNELARNAKNYRKTGKIDVSNPSRWVMEYVMSVQSWLGNPVPDGQQTLHEGDRSAGMLPSPCSGLGPARSALASFCPQDPQDA